MDTCVPRQETGRGYVPRLHICKEKIVQSLNHKKHFQHFVLELLERDITLV